MPSGSRIKSLVINESLALPRQRQKVIHLLHGDRRSHAHQNGGPQASGLAALATVVTDDRAGNEGAGNADNEVGPSQFNRHCGAEYH
jgi:hypothetical protein